MRRAIALGAAIAAVLTRVVVAPAQVPDTLTFCANDRSLPMSQVGSPAGFEVEVARALAARLGSRARFEWLDPDSETVEQAVLQGRCGAGLGAIVNPGEMAGDRTVDGVTLTAPYYTAGYLLVRNGGARPVARLAELGGARIAVEAESIAAFTLRQRGHAVHVLSGYRAVIEAVAAGREDYGYVWGPLAAWLVRDRRDVVLVQEFEPVERWDFAIAVRDEAEELHQALEAAIRALRREGVLRELLAGYGVPWSNRNGESPASGTGVRKTP